MRRSREMAGQLAPSDDGAWARSVDQAELAQVSHKFAGAPFNIFRSSRQREGADTTSSRARKRRTAIREPLRSRSYSKVPIQARFDYPAATPKQRCASKNNS